MFRNLDNLQLNKPHFQEQSGSTRQYHLEADKNRHLADDEVDAGHDFDIMDMWNDLLTMTRCTHDETELHGCNLKAFWMRCL